MLFDRLSPSFQCCCFLFLFVVPLLSELASSMSARRRTLFKQQLDIRRRCCCCDPFWAWTHFCSQLLCVNNNSFSHHRSSTEKGELKGKEFVCSRFVVVRSSSGRATTNKSRTTKTTQRGTTLLATFRFYSLEARISWRLFWLALLLCSLPPLICCCGSAFAVDCCDGINEFQRNCCINSSRSSEWTSS